MLYSDHPRVHYDKPQLAEVICQLRFPAILSIGSREPVDFQEAVRGMFPGTPSSRSSPRPLPPPPARGRRPPGRW